MPTEFTMRKQGHVHCLFREEPRPSSCFMDFFDQIYLGWFLLEIHRFRSPTDVIRCDLSGGVDLNPLPDGYPGDSSKPSQDV